MSTLRPRRPLWVDAALLAALCLVVFAVAPAGHGLTNWQESQRLVVAHEMLARGDWIVPTFDGRPYLAKPPLFYWVQMSLATLRGSPVTEVDLRLAAALGGLLGVLATWWAALRLFGHEAGEEPAASGPEPRTAAFLAGLLLATGILYVRSSRIGELDVWLVPFVSGAIGFIFVAWRRRARGGRTAWPHVAGAAACAAGAALTKGPPGLVMIVLGGYAGIALAAALHPEQGASRARAVWRACAATHPVGVLGVGVAALWGWATLVSRRIGEQVVEDSAEFQARSNLILFSPEAPVRNLETMAYGLGLGSVLGALAIVWLLKDRPRLRPGWVVVLAWLGLGFVAFSVLGKGVPRYLTPLWPAIAALGGLFAAQWISTTPRPRALRAGLYTAAVLLGVGQAAWYGVGREWYSADRSPRGVLAELRASPELSTLPIVLVGFETPAVAYYLGSFPQVFDCPTYRSVSTGAQSPPVAALCGMMAPGERRLALVAAPDGAEAADAWLTGTGLVAEVVPTAARFTPKAGRLPVEVFLVTRPADPAAEVTAGRTAAPAPRSSGAPSSPARAGMSPSAPPARAGP